MLARRSGVGGRARLCVGSGTDDHRTRRGRRYAPGIGARRCHVLESNPRRARLCIPPGRGRAAAREHSGRSDCGTEREHRERNAVSVSRAVGFHPGRHRRCLSDADFITFSTHWPNGKGLVAIKSIRSYPLTLPNVARNVIAHELGHAIGLAHNSDPTMLMCGRPAPCRPMEFQSATEHYFPLTSDEKALLLQLYPANWHPGR
jgi:hypothetical protein